MSQRVRILLGRAAESLFIATVCIAVPLLLMSHVAAIATGSHAVFA